MTTRTHDTCRTALPVLEAWDGVSEPTEAMYAALQKDLAQARKDKTIGKVATRVNRELPGGRSLLTSSARRAARLEASYTGRR